MALNIILTCLTAVSTLNFVLILDLANRSKKLTALYEQARRVVNKMHRALSQQG